MKLCHAATVDNFPTQPWNVKENVLKMIQARVEQKILSNLKFQNTSCLLLIYHLPDHTTIFQKTYRLRVELYNNNCRLYVIYWIPRDLHFSDLMTQQFIVLTASVFRKQKFAVNFDERHTSADSEQPV